MNAPLTFQVQHHAETMAVDDVAADLEVLVHLQVQVRELHRVPGLRRLLLPVKPIQVQKAITVSEVVEYLALIYKYTTTNQYVPHCSSLSLEVSGFEQTIMETQAGRVFAAHSSGTEAAGTR